MAESELGRQLGAAVQASLAEAARYLALVTQTNPGGSAEALLRRPDVGAVLEEALEEAQASAQAVVEQAWIMSGAPGHPSYSRLQGDVIRTFAQLAHLRSLVREAYSSVPHREFEPGLDAPGTHPGREAAGQRADAVREAVLGWGRQSALRARMTLSTAEGTAATYAVLEAGHGLASSGRPVRKRWRRDPASRSCIWCRRLDGVSIPLRDSFAPYLGAPAVLGTGTRHVATPAGAAKYGLPIGALIIVTHPPRLYHGDLQGPLLHPFCNCRLEVTGGLGSQALPLGGGGWDEPGGQQSPAPQVPFLTASAVRAMPEEDYQAHLAFLRAAVHELDQVLRRLAEGDGDGDRG